jgi:uncharacterized membrane protein YeaQ/YmgE (transglycosylase-associated protein family)
MNFVWWIIVGLVAGWATGKIMKGSGYGALMDIGLGIVGAVVGGMLTSSLGVYTSGGVLPTILVAILGAVVVVVVVRLLRRV